MAKTPRQRRRHLKGRVMVIGFILTIAGLLSTFKKQSMNATVRYLVKSDDEKKKHANSHGQAGPAGTGQCLTDGCYHVFIDVGSNKGVHGRFLFEPLKYEKSIMATKRFPLLFGGGGSSSMSSQGIDYRRQNVCVVALEPNPLHAQTQQATASAYEKMGWRYYYLPVAVSDHYGNMTFYKNHHSEAEQEVGFGIKQRVGVESDGSSTATATTTNTTSTAEQQIQQEVTVQVIDFAHFLHDSIFCRSLPQKSGDDVHHHVFQPRVVIKMDIEGSEYCVWKRLITATKKEGLDLSQIHAWFGEEHPKLAPLTINCNIDDDNDNNERDATTASTTMQTSNDLIILSKLLRQQIQNLGSPKFELFDDEAYANDVDMEYPIPP